MSRDGVGLHALELFLHLANAREVELPFSETVPSARVLGGDLEDLHLCGTYRSPALPASCQANRSWIRREGQFERVRSDTTLASTTPASTPSGDITPMMMPSAQPHVAVLALAPRPDERDTMTIATSEVAWAPSCDPGRTAPAPGRTGRRRPLPRRPPATPAAKPSASGTGQVDGVHLEDQHGRRQGWRRRRRPPPSPRYAAGARCRPRRRPPPAAIRRPLPKSSIAVAGLAPAASASITMIAASEVPVASFCP